MAEDELQSGQSTAPARDAGETPERARLTALLDDLTELAAYLEDRGRHTYELAQRFMANAQRDASARAYDERQATMLEYQHYIWHEIAGRVKKLLVTYEDEAETMATTATTESEE
ncbi:MAG: hypothetical protein OJF49_001294 [Ktedonobacterales bacterium]|jgi:hypothetical protein|nr:MAG: hypothetical protein OJF49_001294 [Ktedonobacterales bacterium]